MGAVMATTTSTKQAWARGGLVMAASLLILIGTYQFFMGLAAVVEDQFFVVGENYYYNVDTTAWGWIHMGIGVVAVAVGFYLFTGATLARWLGIALCVVSAVANFFWLPYYPLWGLLIIAVDIFAIWAIATARIEPEYSSTAMGAGAGTGAAGTTGMGAGTYGGDATQTGERWPAENVPGRHSATQDVDARVAAERAQQEEQQRAAQTGQQTGQQAGRDMPRGN
jgi:hypothetical protein